MFEMDDQSMVLKWSKKAYVVIQRQRTVTTYF